MKSSRKNLQNRRTQGYRTYGYILSALAAAGCTTTPVDDQSPAQAGEALHVEGGQTLGGMDSVHVVQPGDTLWSIAWRYRVDVQDLARWNQLDDPNLILVGQGLILGPRGSAGSVAGQRRRSPATGPRSDQSGPAWQWPVQGPLVSLYGASQYTPDGIGIGGEVGADIRAAAAGQVVYAGDGLAAYGNLIIIKHNDTYLSAYGQNDEVAVAEGDTVNQGQVIAKMGLGPELQPQVHFEIRRDGSPVDPLTLLPN